jgi:hypothetical protein
MEIKQNFKEKLKSKLGLFLIKASTRIMIKGINLTKHKVRLTTTYKKVPVEVKELNSELFKIVGENAFHGLPLEKKIIKRTIIKEVKHLRINANKPCEQKFINALELGLYNALSKLSDKRLRVKDFDVFEENPLRLVESSPEHSYAPKVYHTIFSQSQANDIFEFFLTGSEANTKQKLEFEWGDMFMVKIDISFNERTKAKTVNLKFFNGDSEIFSELISKETIEKIVEKIKNSDYGIL